MSEITRYSEFKYEGGFYVDDVDGEWCKFADIAPIIQRNAELETENSVQRLQIDHLEAELTRLRGSKQPELPAALVEWSNSSEYYELTQWNDGYEAARRWVKMQLKRMKGKS